MTGLNRHDADVARTWAELRADGYLPTQEYRTPAEQLQSVRDLLAAWSQRPDTDLGLVRQLARALGVRAHGRSRPRVRPDPLPTPNDVPCPHGLADGFCVECAAAPLLFTTDNEEPPT